MLALLVFGALFASADALVATWVDAVVPDLTFGDLVAARLRGRRRLRPSPSPARTLALNPAGRRGARGGRAAPLPRTASSGWCRCCWSTPSSRSSSPPRRRSLFGGHDYLERTTGLTYADYVHQGFGQLTVATALTLLVVWAAARRAGDVAAGPALAAASRWGCSACSPWSWSASALHRMHLYQEAYGFTTLRLVVDVFEGWLGLVVSPSWSPGCSAPGAWRRRGSPW